MHDKIITALLAVLIATWRMDPLENVQPVTRHGSWLKKKYRGLKMKYRTLKLLRRRKNARRRSRTTEKGVQALIIGLALVLFLLVGCENIKHKIGISQNSFQSGEDLEIVRKSKDHTTVFVQDEAPEDD